PPPVPVDVAQQGGRLACRPDQIGPFQQRPGLGQGGDRQAVPGGHDLVVAAGPYPGGAGGEQCGAYPCEAFGVVRVGRELQDGGAVLEGARLGDVEDRGRPRGVVGGQDVAELVGGPHVELAFHPLAVGVQRGGEATLGGAHFAQQPLGGLQRDAAAQ